MCEWISWTIRDVQLTFRRICSLGIVWPLERYQGTRESVFVICIIKTMGSAKDITWRHCFGERMYLKSKKVISVNVLAHVERKIRISKEIGWKVSKLNWGL